MAESKIKASNITEAINTEITGVTAVKVGKIATLKISRTSQTYTAGWNTLGTLPDSLKPSSLGSDFLGIDNTIASYSDAKVIKCNIGVDGRLYAYIPSDRTTVALLANVTYITQN